VFVKIASAAAATALGNHPGLARAPVFHVEHFFNNRNRRFPHVATIGSSNPQQVGWANTHLRLTRGSGSAQTNSSRIARLDFSQPPSGSLNNSIAPHSGLEPLFLLPSVGAECVPRGTLPGSENTAQRRTGTPGPIEALRLPDRLRRCVNHEDLPPLQRQG
jgi:hypothetical protein